MPAGARPEAPPHPDQPRALDAHARDGRPVEPDGHQRGQVPHRLRREGRGRRRPPSSRRAIERYYDHGHADVRRGALAARQRRRRGRPHDEDEIDLQELEKCDRGGAGRPARERAPDRRHPQARERHPRRALREDAPRPLPHRRRALRDHAAADAAQERHHLAHQGHGAARHRRAPPAAGRPHQDEARGRQRDGLPRLRACPPSSARRSCSASSTSRTCSST